MKIIILGLAGLISSGSFAGECSKEITKKQVERVCEAIKAKGMDAKNEELTFENCGKNYVWVQDASKPTLNMIVHPIKRRLNGKRLDQHADENGVKLFVEFDKKAKAEKDGGWVDYMWAKPGKEKATPKTSFVKLCEGKGVKWIAGSGIWKEDLK
ncbi:MAG: cache domain-containing protein [Halobacteriovoraceae bacterium]|nr:cache domain-containing protein [Halobacteriovoraceae bacterium]